MQASLWDSPQVRRSLGEPSRPAIELRPYQLEACDRIDAALARVRSALLVMATGTGKTTVFSEAIRRRQGRCLVLAHRDELIRQAAKRIGAQTGRTISLEKADERAGHTQVVVASIQTLGQGREEAARGPDGAVLLNEDGTQKTRTVYQRLQRFRPDEFELVVVDEAHHAVADSYRRVFEHFAGARILGVTATPDRADELAMGAVFDEVAYQYEIADAIRDGWLCRVSAMQVQCDAIDLTGVKTVAGDLNAGQLDDVMKTERALHQVAKPTLEQAGERRTLVFTTSVENAHRLAEVFCRYRPDCARAVDGGTDPLTRRRILADHQAGRFQFLVNVGVLTEGYDDPQVACVAMGRPTKSRALYAQMAGRGTRTAPGKTDLLLLDFVGNSGRHALVSAVDVLAGEYPDEVVARAKKLISREPRADARAMLDKASAQLAEEERRRQEAKRRAAGRAKVVKYSMREVDPFAVLGLDVGPADMRVGDAPATENQIATLQKMRIPVPDGLTKRAAWRILAEQFRRRREGLCTFRQAAALQKKGYDTRAMTFEAARALMDALMANGFKPLTRDQEMAALARFEPGARG